MKQQVHHWNIHNHVNIATFIEELIQEGHSIKSTMATAYQNQQVIRAVIVTETPEQKEFI